jgi:hypothetical protein
MIEAGRCLLSWKKQNKQKTLLHELPEETRESSNAHANANANANAKACRLVIPPFPTSGEAGKWALGTFDFGSARIAGFFKHLFPPLQILFASSV